MKNDKEKIINLLAEYQGVSAEDINLDDSLTEDLLMGASDITDFTQTLEENGFETDKLDYTQIETITDLLEALGVLED